MARTEREPKGPFRGLKEIVDISPGSHICLLYRSEEEHRALLTEYIRAGLQRGERVVYIVDAHTACKVRSYLREAGIAPREAERRGELRFLTSDEAYLRRGTFNPQGMISLLVEETQQALTDGFIGLRVTGEMSWALRGLPGSERLIEYEALLNEFFPGSACTGLCQYDVRRFSAGILLDVMRTHPVIAVGTRVHENPFYIPPEEFLYGSTNQATLNRWLETFEERLALLTSLRESEEKYRTLFESASDAIFLMKHDRFIDCNEKTLEMYACEREDILNKTPYHQFSPPQQPDGRDSKEKALEKIEAALAGEPQLFEWQHRRLNGELFHTEVHLSRLKLGEEYFLQAVVRDISERKEREKALADQQALLSAIYRNAPVVMMVVDGERRIRQVNSFATGFAGRPAKEMLGLRSGEALRCLHALDDPQGRGFGEFCHRCVIRNAVLHTLETGETHRQVEAPYYFQDADGEVREMTLLCSTTPLSMGEESLVLVTLLDITQRKQMEEERERLVAEVSAQARQLQAILDTVPQGVLLLDDEGGILHANPMAEKALAVLARAREGDALSRLGDRPLAELLTSPPVKGLWHEVKVDGSTFEVIARPVEQGAAPERWVLVLNDVTREREVQTQLQQQERLATVGQLAGGIAHDFNNILGVIILYAGMLAQSEALTDQDRERAAIIREQGWQASRLIQQILDFSRRALLERQPLDLLPLLKEQVKMLQRTLPEHIEIVLNHREDQYVVSADLMRIQQMIMNLALNARDAMPEGGTLRIGLDKIEVRPGESPLLPEMEAGEWVQLTVSDTGTGITPDVLPHIFEPFFTTKGPGKGSGLGLAQVEGIVGQHGGRIGVTTELGRGTTFTVYLPALAARPTEPPTADVSIMPQGRGEMVLVVEDQEAVRTALVQSLEQMNYRTLEAANGEQALAVMQERGEQVALVLSDVVMPGIGGIRLLHALREQGWQTPVILLTGHAMRENLENLQAQGLSAWLPKPPNLEQLAQAIAGALGSTNGDLLQGEEGKS